MKKHWSQVEYLHNSVRNPNIIIKGTKSYYSNAYTSDFEDYVVRYLYGDEYSSKNFSLLWEPDKLHIGNYVCIGAETVILMGGNSTHRMDFFSSYPFVEEITNLYQSKGDTIIKDGVWIGMRAMIMPGVKIGEGAVVAANSVVTKDVEPYTIVGGNPCKVIGERFNEKIIAEILELNIYDKSEIEIDKLIPCLCDNDILKLREAINKIKP